MNTAKQRVIDIVNNLPDNMNDENEVLNNAFAISLMLKRSGNSEGHVVEHDDAMKRIDSINNNLEMRRHENS